MSGLADIESALDRFHQWLAEVRAEADGASAAVVKPEAPEASGRPFGLIDLVEEFTGLRQELKLQTKSSRGLQEQAESLLPPLSQAIELFRSVAPQEEQAAWNAGKPLAEGLATLDEALDRCRREIEKAHTAATEQTPRKLVEALDQVHAGQSWLRRKLFRRYHGQVREAVQRQAQGIHHDWLQSLLEGFDLIQNRLRRLMRSECIEPIGCLGRPVDPDRMIVVEVAEAPDCAPGTVIEELRRGYTWRGRVLRLAEVRAVRGPRAGDRAEPEGEADAGAEDDPDGEPFEDNGSRSTWLETE